MMSQNRKDRDLQSKRGRRQSTERKKDTVTKFPLIDCRGMTASNVTLADRSENLQKTGFQKQTEDRSRGRGVGQTQFPDPYNRNRQQDLNIYPGYKLKASSIKYNPLDLVKRKGTLPALGTVKQDNTDVALSMQVIPAQNRAIKPAERKPAILPPIEKTPAEPKPAAKKPAVPKRRVPKPAERKPAVLNLTEIKPAVKTSAVKKPAEKKPVALTVTVTKKTSAVKTVVLNLTVSKPAQKNAAVMKPAEVNAGNPGLLPKRPTMDQLSLLPTNVNTSKEKANYQVGQISGEHIRQLRVFRSQHPTTKPVWKLLDGHKDSLQSDIQTDTSSYVPEDVSELQFRDCVTSMTNKVLQEARSEVMAEFRKQSPGPPRRAKLL